MDAAAPSPSLSIRRGPNCLIVRVDPAENPANAALKLVDRLLAALESHGLKSVVVEASECSNNLLSELAALRDRIGNRGGSVKIVGQQNERRDDQGIPQKDEDTGLAIYPDLNAAFFEHRRPPR